MLTVLLGLGALMLVIGLLLPPRHPAPAVSLPVSTGSGRYGLLGLMRWLEASGVPAYRLRRRYQALGRPPFSARGNLLVITLPQRLSSQPLERRALHEWVARGNAVLILSATLDAPPWASRAAPGSAAAVLRSLGLHLQWQHAGCSAAGVAAPGRLLAPAVLVPAMRAPVLTGIHSVQVAGRALTPFAAGLAGPHRVWPLLQDDQARRPVLFQTRIGSGIVWFSEYSELFGNAGLGRGDNARLFAHLVRRALGAHGRVVFDDMHQGASVLYDPHAFVRDPRLHVTIGFLVAFWLLYLLGRSARLGPVPSATRTVRSTGYLIAAGGLYARMVPGPVLARTLFAEFFNEIRRRHRLPEDGTPAWEVLERDARAGAAQVRRLRALHAALGRRGRPDLVALANLMGDLRRQMV